MSDVTIDKVQIEVEASAKSANKVLEQLERNLKSVKSAMAGFDTSGIEKLQKALDGIGKAANNASNVKVTPKVDTSNITKSEKQISNSVANLQDRFTRLGALANAALGGDKSAITSFQRQAVSMQAEIDVVQNKLRRLGDTRVQSPAFINLEENIQRASNLLDALKEKNKNLYGGKAAPNDANYVRLQDNIKTVSDLLDQLTEKQQQMLKDGTAYTDPLQGYRDSIKSIQDALTALIEKINAVKDDKPSVDTSKVIANIQQAIKWADNLIKKLLSLGGAAISKVLHGLGNAFNKIKDGASKTRSAVGKLNGVFDKGFMKILKYGLGIRSIYVLFRRLRKAVVESFGELQKSGAFFQTTKANIEGLKTSLATLKFQFGAAFEPIFNTVAPALQSFINYLIKAMNVLSAFIAKVSGKDTYSKVAAVTLAAANNTASAARAAKELNKQLQGFDELNNLTTNDNAGGGGGGGGGASGDSAVYEEASVESALGDFGKALADAIAKGDWELVGKTIGDKLTAELKKLNEKWPEIFAAANDFGTNLAKFFNGLISDDLFGEVGEAIGSAINAALTASLAFAKEFHWDDLGSAIATGIDEFVKTNPLKLVVDNFNEWANGILDTLITAVDKLLEKGTIDKISEHIAKALAQLEIGEIAWKVGKLGSSLATSLYKIVSNKETWINLGQKIADGINGFFAGMNEVNEDGLTGWEVLGKTIEETFTGIATSLTTALEGVNWVEVGQSIATFIGSINWNDVKWAFGNLKTAVENALKGLLQGLGIDGEDVAVTIAKVALIIGAIGAVKLAATITKLALTQMIENAVTALVGANVPIKALGLAIAVGGVVLSDSTTGEGGLVGLATNAAFNLLGATTTYAGLRMMGLKIGLSLKIAACTLAWGIGTSIGKYIGEKVSTLLFGEQEGGGENGELPKYYQEFTWKGFIKEVKLAGKQGVLKEAWDKLWDDLYAPVFDEGKQVKIKLDVGFEKLTDAITKAKNDFDAAWDSAFNGKSKTPVGRNGMPSDVSQIVDAQEQSEMNKHGYNLWMGIYKGFETAMAISNPITIPLIALKNMIGDFFKDKEEGFGEGSPCENMKPHGQYIYEGIIEGFLDAVKKLGGTYSVDTAISTLKSALEAQLTQQFTGWDAGQFISGVANLTLGLKTTIETTADALGDEISKLKEDIKKKLGTVSITTKLKNVTSKQLKKVKDKLKSWREGVNKDNKLTFSIDVTSNVKSLSKWVDDNIIEKINRTMRNVTPKYDPIPKITGNKRGPFAATGGFADKATNVTFGEAGAEAILPLERNLGAIDKIATVMLNGMEKVSKYRYSASPSALAFGGSSMSQAYVGSMSRGDSEALQEQNKLLAEQNRLLQIIANKDVTISSRDVFNATRSEAQNYNNRTGNSPFLF